MRRQRHGREREGQRTKSRSIWCTRRDGGQRVRHRGRARRGRAGRGKERVQGAGEAWVRAGHDWRERARRCVPTCSAHHTRPSFLLSVPRSHHQQRRPTLPDLSWLFKLIFFCFVKLLILVWFTAFSFSFFVSLSYRYRLFPTSLDCLV